MAKPLDPDTRFDVIVGALEDLVLSDSFRQRHETFCYSNCEKFSSSGEYDVECTSIFQSFQAQTEEALNTGLIERLAWFEMDDFLSLVAQRGDELHSDVFDVLMTMSEFEEFADLMSSFRDEKYGSGRLGDLSLALSVTSLAADALPATESCTADGEGKQQAAEHK